TVARSTKRQSRPGAAVQVFLAETIRQRLPGCNERPPRQEMRRPSFLPMLACCIAVVGFVSLELIVRELLAAHLIDVSHQRRMAKRRLSCRSEVRLTRAALDNSALSRGPTTEHSAVSQLLEAGPQSDDSDEKSESGSDDCFHQIPINSWSIFEL